MRCDFPLLEKLLAGVRHKKMTPEQLKKFINMPKEIKEKYTANGIFSLNGKDVYDFITDIATENTTKRAFNYNLRQSWAETEQLAGRIHEAARPDYLEQKIIDATRKGIGLPPEYQKIAIDGIAERLTYISNNDESLLKLIKQKDNNAAEHIADIWREEIALMQASRGQASMYGRGLNYQRAVKEKLRAIGGLETLFGPGGPC